MRRHTATLALITGGAVLGAGTAHAQLGRGAGEWNSNGADAHRSSWVRTDAKISPAAMAKPGFALLWKQKLDTPRQQNSLTPPLVMGGYIGYKGFRTLGFVGGASGKVYGIDVDLGRNDWSKTLPGGEAAGGTAACPGGLTSSTARVLTAQFPQTGGGFGGGRGRANTAKSAVGDPGEGAPILKEMAAAAAARGGAPDAGRGGRGGQPGGRGPGAPGERPRRQPNFLYVLGPDGILHHMYVSNGDEPQPGPKFLGPNANAHGLIVVDGMAYVATTNGCGNVTDGIWGLNLETKAVTNWAGKVAGSSGPAVGPDGTVYVSTTGGDLVALEGKTLKVKEVYQAKSELTTSPVLFQYKDKTIAAAATKDGSIHLVDVAKMAAPFAPPAQTGANGSGIASWQDADGARWLLVPTASAVSAWKLVEQNGTASLQKGWTSRDITAPVAPLIVNGVVFAASTGSRTAPTVLYAMDGGTGKEVFNSAKTITGFLPKNGGISAGATQVYLGTHDGTLYAFGFPMEH